MQEPENLSVYAHVKDGKVVNTSVWDGVQPYTPPDGADMIPLPTYRDDEGVERHIGGIGWDYIDGEFVDNRPVDEYLT
jgi:hypothetical protein